jgi:hypothetical protein
MCVSHHGFCRWIASLGFHFATLFPNLPAAGTVLFALCAHIAVPVTVGIAALVDLAFPAALIAAGIAPVAIAAFGAYLLPDAFFAAIVARWIWLIAGILYAAASAELIHLAFLAAGIADEIAAVLMSALQTFAKEEALFITPVKAFHFAFALVSIEIGIPFFLVSHVVIRIPFVISYRIFIRVHAKIALGYRSAQ